MTVRRAALAALLALSLLPAPARAAAPVALWNGKDLSNWSFFLVDPKAKMDDVWSVRDGMIVCKGEPLGFLCLVNAERDKPQLPTEAQLAELRSLPNIGAFLNS